MCLVARAICALPSSPPRHDIRSSESTTRKPWLPQRSASHTNIAVKNYMAHPPFITTKLCTTSYSRIKPVLPNNDITLSRFVQPQRANMRGTSVHHHPPHPATGRSYLGEPKILAPTLTCQGVTGMPSPGSLRQRSATYVCPFVLMQQGKRSLSERGAGG
jgi:hypothetical protein